jgi:hypothetical protein
MLGRLLLATIFFVCLAAVMVSLLQGSLDEATTGTETEAGEAPVTTPTRQTAPTAVAAVSPAPPPAPPRTTTTSLTEGIPPSQAGAPAPEAAPSRSPGTYVRNSADVYSSNFGTGQVLTRLEEGAQVDRGVSILNQEGWWVEIRVDQTAGFVRSEDLVDN